MFRKVSRITEVPTVRTEAEELALKKKLKKTAKKKKQRKKLRSKKKQELNTPKKDTSQPTFEELMKVPVLTRSRG